MLLTTSHSPLQRSTASDLECSSCLGWARLDRLLCCERCIVREVIARRIIATARKGERDPAKLCGIALAAFDSDKSADNAAPAEEIRQEVMLKCPRCGLMGSAIISEGPPVSVEQLPPECRLADTAEQSPNGKPNIRGRCDERKMRGCHVSLNALYPSTGTAIFDRCLRAQRQDFDPDSPSETRQSWRLLDPVIAYFAKTKSPGRLFSGKFTSADQLSR